MTVEERLTKLEKSVKRWRWMSHGLIAIVVGLGGAVGWDYFGVHGTIKAKRLIVVNDKGMAIDLDSAEDGGGVISLHDSMNIERVLIGNSQKGIGTIELYSGARQKMVSLGGSGSGGQIAVYNNSGRKVIDAQASKTNSGAIAINDFDGNHVHGLFGDSHNPRR